MPENSSPIDSRLRGQFSIRAQSFNQSARWILDDNLLQAHVDLIGTPLPNQNRLLDLCCGTGIVGTALKRQGWEPTGVDITPEMVAVAAKTFPAVVGKIEALPFPDQSFDACVIRQSFMLLDGEKSLLEIKRVLKPGGLFIFSQSIAFSEQDETHYRKIQETRHINMLRYYNRDDLKDTFRKHYFIEEKNIEFTVRENSTQWVNRAPELSEQLRRKILNLIVEAPEEYRRIRNVKIENEELFEDWNWLVLRLRNENSSLEK